MSALTAASVTYTLAGLPTPNNFSSRSVTATLTFGDGSSTYPSGGIPISGAMLGLPNNVSRLDIFDQGTSGYFFSFDYTNKTIRMFNSLGSHTHSTFLANAAVADGATTRVNAGANLLGANTGSSITVAGIAAASGAAGGVVAVAAGQGSELSTSATPASVTINVQANGY